MYAFSGPQELRPVTRVPPAPRFDTLGENSARVESWGKKLVTHTSKYIFLFYLLCGELLFKLPAHRHRKKSPFSCPSSSYLGSASGPRTHRKHLARLHPLPCVRQRTVKTVEGIGRSSRCGEPPGRAHGDAIFSYPQQRRPEALGPAPTFDDAPSSPDPRRPAFIISTQRCEITRNLR